jgi:cytochrome c-type biogenesis protein CcmH/NrfG
MDSRPVIVQNGQGSGEPCLDANLLASYIDGRATPAERSSVEAHLARCDDCYSVFSETFQEQTTQAGPAPETLVTWLWKRVSVVWRMPAGLAPTAQERWTQAVPVPAPAGTLARIGVGWRMTAGVAAAASIVLAVQVYRTNTRQQEDGSLVVALHELDAAAGPHRTFDGRLTGDRYRPLTAAMRSGSTNTEIPLEVREAAQKVELAAQGNSPEMRHALAIMYLRLNQPQRAADVAAPLEKSSEAALQNDLAVAILARRSEGDAKRAMDLLEQVVAREPNRAEAWFNLGLAAEAAGDVTRAGTAWARYLDLDPSSQWAAEARAHLEKLRSTATVDPREPTKNDTPR